VLTVAILWFFGSLFYIQTTFLIKLVSTTHCNITTFILIYSATDRGLLKKKLKLNSKMCNRASAKSFFLAPSTFDIMFRNLKLLTDS